MSEIIQRSLFEKNFIERTYSNVVSDMSIAFSELVANSWDAGATNVWITIPDKKGEEIVIEDNGTGMTDKEFQQRWMVIAYNRVAHQGEYIEYLSSNGAAKRLARHLIVVQADCLIDDVYYDWSQFINTEKVKEVFVAVTRFVREFRVDYYKGKVTEVRKDVIEKNINKIETLSIPALYDLKNFFSNYLEQKPEIDNEELNTIIGALISVLQSRNGMSLLEKLSAMDIEDVDTLNSILDEWSVSDIKDVLDEIDRRLKVINAIEQLCSNPSTDELHVLHPLVSQAKWLFGIEYDNMNYTFNKALTTVLHNILKGQRKGDINVNWAKRPDLVIGSDFSVSSTCVEDVDDNDMLIINKVLIIELKRGGFIIDRQEMNQAEEYIDSLYKGNKLNCKPRIKAFVVGDAVSPAISNKKRLEDYGEVYAYTYKQLTQTAGKRLFNLKEKLSVRYQELNVNDYLLEILGEPRQMELDFSD